MSDLEKIKNLRQSTGAGFKDCSSALKESSGDIDKAIEILRIKGVAKASKKMSRDAKEGVMVVSGDESKTSVLELNCETDFVAKNENFIKFAKELGDLNNLVDSDIEKLKKSKMQNSNSVEENLVTMIAKIGEKITLGRSKTLKNDNSKNYFYLHTVVKDNLSKLAVIVSLNLNEENEKVNIFGKQLSMHIAASNPLAISPEKIDVKIIEKENELINEELKNSGKPDEIIKKISIGKINKFKEEASLMTQDWVMDPKKKVKDIINELKVDNLNVVDFCRYKIGE
ncbi:MAG: translation elongation factor Ts [Pelagibacteraceae bacterium]|nr:translation elongation factor Ts [Pelagibacteraceae bacterium]|tara:strand:+ start:782 stop:1633 length:852 start_codon:yes stop_codon:yes gene_type:complete